MVQFDPYRLLVLAEVERAGSIAGAARNLGYSEATLAHHIRILQRQAAAPLTRRAGRTVELTPLGAALAGRGAEISRQLTAAADDTVAHADLSTGTLRLVAFPSYCASVLPELLAAFVERYPGVDLTLTEYEPRQALAQLGDGVCDVAIVFADDLVAIEDRRWNVRVLFVDPIHVVVPASHPTAASTGVDIGDLADETWIGGCDDCRQQLVRLAAHAHFEPRILLATDDYLAVQRFVSNGLGVALLPRLALDNSPADPGIATLALDPPARRFVVAVTPRAATMPARTFVDMLPSAPTAG